MGEKKEYKKFQELLRKGIGTRSQKDFAEQVGITAPHLSRMLNSDTIARPSVETLKKLVAHISDASLNEFLVACDYDPIKTEDLVIKVEAEFEQGIEETKGTMVKSLNDFLDIIPLLYLSEPAKIDIKEEKKIDVSEFSNAEFKTKVIARWNHEDVSIRTEFDLYYVKTSTGKIIVTGSSLSNEENKRIDSEWTKEVFVLGENIFLKRQFHNSTLEKFASDSKKIMKNEADLILNYIFGEEEVMTTVVGYGFYYKETPDGFRDFLINHASSFCTSSEKLEVYQKCLEKNSDIDGIFKEFYHAENDECCTGIVVAEILRNETGLDFHFYDDECDNGDDCVMFEEEKADRGKNIKKYSPMLFSCAKELKLPTFGLCYHKTRLTKLTNLEYETEKYYLQMV